VAASPRRHGEHGKHGERRERRTTGRVDRGAGRTGYGARTPWLVLRVGLFQRPGLPGSGCGEAPGGRLTTPHATTRLRVLPMGTTGEVSGFVWVPRECRRPRPILASAGQAESLPRCLVGGGREAPRRREHRGRPAGDGGRGRARAAGVARAATAEARIEAQTRGRLGVVSPEFGVSRWMELPEVAALTRSERRGGESGTELPSSRRWTSSCPLVRDRRRSSFATPGLGHGPGGRQGRQPS